MGIVFRQSVKTSLITFAGALLGALVMWTSLHYIPKQSLGFRNNLTNQAVVISQMLLLGFHSTLAVYIHRYKGSDIRRPALISITLAVPGLLLVGLTPIYFLFRNQIIHLFQPQDIALLTRYYAWLPVFILFFIYQILLEQYLISQMKVAVASFMREILLRLLNIILIMLFGWGIIDFDVLIGGTVLVYLVPNIILLFLASKTEYFGLTTNWKVFSREELKEIIHFTWFHSLMTISVNLMGYLDALMLAALATEGMAAAAVYSVATFIMSFMQIPYRVMVNASFPVIAQAFQEKDMAKVRDLFSRSSINILLTSVLMTLLICCNLDNASFFLPKGYESFAAIVLILSIGRLADAATGMNDQILSISIYYRASFYISILLVVLLVAFNFALIPVYGIYGAAWASSLALMFYNVGKLVFVWAKLGLQPFSRATSLILFSGVLAAAAGFMLPFIINPFVDGMVRSLVITIIYLSGLIMLKASPDLNQYLISVKKNRKLF